MPLANAVNLEMLQKNGIWFVDKERPWQMQMSLACFEKICTRAYKDWLRIGTFLAGIILDFVYCILVGDFFLPLVRSFF